MTTWHDRAVALLLFGSVLSTGRCEDVIDSEIGQVNKALDGLGANSSVMLPAAKVQGEFNELAKKFHLDKRGPGSRDFTIKMVWAPERKRALFCGANHGVPHRLNDCWEFDLPTNTWHLLYAPDFNDGRNGRELNSKVVLKDGVIQTERGGPVHVAHTWAQVTYDPLRKRLLWMCCWPGQQRLHEIYNFPKADLYHGPPLWSFDPAAKKWELLKTEGIGSYFNAGTTMEYISDLKGSLLQGKWLLPADESTWKSLKAKGDAKDFPRNEAVVAYDTANRMLIAHQGTPEMYRDRKVDPTKRTWGYDVETNKWKLLVESANGPSGHDAWTPFGYDPIGQVLLLRDALDAGKLWAFSVKDKKWTPLQPNGPAAPKSGRGQLCYFDVERNVFVVIAPEGTWLYRNKR